MSEAPKKIWRVEQHGYASAPDVLYIRADLVDGLGKALEGLLSCPDDPLEIMEKVIAAKKALAALKAIEEE